jgi:hypothetical protein
MASMAHDGAHARLPFYAKLNAYFREHPSNLDRRIYLSRTPMNSVG